MKAISRALTILAYCGGLMTWGGVASGQSNTAAAEVLFEQGRADMDAGNYEAACDKFRQSDQLDPAVGTKFNLADCEEKRGRLATAWELFKAVERGVAPGTERYEIAKQRREAIEPRVPKLKLTLAAGAPSGTIVRIGNAEFGSGTFGVPLPLDPGQYTVVVVAPMHAERRLAATLQEGRITEIVVQPGEPTQAAPAPAAQPAPAAAPPAPAGVAPAEQPPAPASGAYPPPADQPPPSGGNKTMGYVLAGVGAAGVVVGGVTGIMVLNKKKTADAHCYPELRACDQTGVDANESGRTLGTVSTVGFAIGLVGLGLGTYFILTSDDEGQPQTALMTQLGPGTSQISLVQRW